MGANNRKKRILFVDDDADATAVIKLGLSRHRFEVDAFVDSQSALQNIKPGVYDLLLLDVLMKGLDGLELYDKMRKIDEYIRVCFISASNTFYGKYKNQYPEIEECFVQKPFTIQKFIRILDSILGN